MRLISIIIRLAWPVLLLTAFVYCWLLVDSLSSKRHETTQQTKAVLELYQTNTSFLHLSQGQKHRSNTSDISSKIQPYITQADENTTWKIRDGLYFNETFDKHEYKYIHNPHSFCQTKNLKPKLIFLLIMIASAPQNIKQRNVLRSIYGAKKAWPRLSKGVIVTIFLLGRTNNETLQMDIDKESDLHGDIIQEDFFDTYENLTIKTVMGLKWVTSHCRHASYVMKTDDDSVIIQTRFFAAFFMSPSTNWAAGNALFDSPVARNISEKFFLPKDFYPSPTYPPYLNGPGYILSIDLVESLFRVAITTPLFPWEDVFIGMCLKKLEVVPKNVDNFLMHAPKDWPVNFKEDEMKPFWVRRYSVITNLDPEYIAMIWEVGRLTFNKS